jgi:hypothetical protein
MFMELHGIFKIWHYYISIPRFDSGHSQRWWKVEELILELKEEIDHNQINHKQ